MPGQLEEPAAAQCRVIAAGTGYSIVATVPLQATLREVFAVGAIGKMTGVGLRLKPWKLFADHATLQHQARLEKVVVTQVDRGGAGFQPQRKALDGRRIRHHPGARHVGRRLIGRGENGLVIAKHQQVSFGRMLEVIVNPLFGTQALNEGQVALAKLHAILALGIGATEVKFELVGMELLLRQHLRNDLRHRLVLEDPLVTAVREIGQLRHKADLVTRQPPPGIALRHPINQAVDAMTVSVEAQVCRTMQQAFQVQVGLFADQFKIKTIRLADGFAALELKHLEFTRHTVEGQGKGTLIGRSEHPVFLCEG